LRQQSTSSLLCLLSVFLPKPISTTCRTTSTSAARSLSGSSTLLPPSLTISSRSTLPPLLSTPQTRASQRWRSRASLEPLDSAARPEAFSSTSRAPQLHCLALRSTPFLFQILIQLDLTLTHLRFSSSSKQLCLCRQASSPRASIEAKLIAANSIGMVSIEYFLIPSSSHLQPRRGRRRTCTSPSGMVTVAASPWTVPVVARGSQIHSQALKIILVLFLDL
jgi:hypothetical protein